MLYSRTLSNHNHMVITLFYSSTTNQHTAKRVLGYNPINDRLISSRLQAKPINITIIQVYALTSFATDDVMDEFYNQLQDTLATASKRDAVFVICDFNAKIGAGHCHEEEKVVIGKFGLGERNKRGDNLVDFCISNDLVVANTPTTSKKALYLAKS